MTTKLFGIAGLLLLTCACGEKAHEESESGEVREMVEFRIEHPPPLAKSWPHNVPKDVRLEPGVQPVNSIRTPQGTVNLASGRPLSTSGDEPIIGELSFITDGRKDRGQESAVKLAPGKQWIQINLGRRCEIFGVAIWRHPGVYASPIYRDVIIQLADDSEFTKNVQTVFNNDHDNSLGFGAGTDFEYYEDSWGKVVECASVKDEGRFCRHVRVWSNGRIIPPRPWSGENQYVEVEVYGLPLPTP